MKTVKLIAPAKVNLFLGIGPLREDSYHSAQTVMHALSMHDSLQMYLVESGEDVCFMEENDPAQPLRQAAVKVDAGQGLQVSARNLWLNGIEAIDIPSEENLACKAVRVLAEELGRSEDETVRIVIEKHIPYQAGLGGGSADAAAALLGAAHMWGVEADDLSIDRAARRLGADVRFFLDGGCLLLEGRGEVPVHALEPRRDSVVIIRPNEGVSTSEAYRLFDETPEFIDTDVINRVYAASHAEEIPLYNNLEPAAESLLSEIVSMREMALAYPGVQQVLLCGSGSAIFAICESYTAAQALAAFASREGYWARSTTFSGIRAAILPNRSRY